MLECTLHATVPVGDSTLVLGRLVHAAVDRTVLVDGHPAADLLQPLSRLGGDEWATLGTVRGISRVRYADRAAATAP